MKKLLIINPNSSEEMTRDIRSTVAYAADSEWSLEVVGMPGSPHVLESFADYTWRGRRSLPICGSFRKREIFLMTAWYWRVWETPVFMR